MRPYLVGKFPVGADEICPFFFGRIFMRPYLVGKFPVGADEICPFFSVAFSCAPTASATFYRRGAKPLLETR